MAKFYVILCQGKQYLVRQGDSIIVDRLNVEPKKTINLNALLAFEENAENVELGQPSITDKVKAVVDEHLKGDKLRVAKFKAKVRYRRVIGFRPALSKITIV